MHGLKAQKHIAQGKRSDTLGMNTKQHTHNALKGQKRNKYGTIIEQNLHTFDISHQNHELSYP